MDILTPVSFPHKEHVDDWKELDQMPLVEQSPTVSPQAVYIRYPQETTQNHYLFSNCPMTCNSDVKQMREFESLIETANQFIHTMYTRRSIGNPLIKFFGRQKKEDGQVTQIGNAVKPHFDSLLDLIKRLMSFATDAGLTIKRYFSAPTNWSTGLWSDNVIEIVCKVIDRLYILDELHLVKSQITQDLTFLMSFVHGVEDIQAIRVWLSTVGSIESQLLQCLSDISADQKKLIGDIFINHIRSNYENHNYYCPEMQYVYLRAMMFILKMSPTDSPEIIKFMQREATEHPLLPLIFECSINFQDRLRKVPGFAESQFPPLKRDFIKLDSHVQKLVDVLSDLPLTLHIANITPKQLLATVTTAIRVVGDAKNAVREQYGLKLSLPPEDKEIPSSYERTLRNGYSDNEKQNLLRIITLWRSVVDLLRENIGTLTKTINPYLNSIIQEFVKNALEVAQATTRRNKDQIDPILEYLRSLFGDFASGEKFYDAQKPGKHTVGARGMSPSPQMLEALRIQIQHLINNGSTYTILISQGIRKVAAIDDKSQKEMSSFVATTKTWGELLEIESILHTLGDQSDLYFKEVQLDLNGVINFPIRASIPFMLSEFALDNYMQPELTELILYPLGIYDDAHAMCERILKSKFMLDEIAAESAICVRTLSTLISDFTFGSFRTYVSLRFLPPVQFRKLKQEYKDHWPGSCAYRLSTLLNQNVFYLHLQQIDMSAMISMTIDRQLNDSVRSLVGLARRGLDNLVAVNRGLEIVRETHRTLTESGVSLMPFDHVLHSVIGDTGPNSFSSPFIIDLVNNICSKVVPKYYLRLYPIRFVTLDKHTLPTHHFGSHSIGKILKTAFEPLASIITAEHLNCLFHMIDEGAIALMGEQLCQNLEVMFDDFTNGYITLKDKLKRIKDAPLGNAGQLVYERYEGVYNFYITDRKCQKLIRSMMKLGNILAIGYLVDIAHEMKRLNRTQIAEFLRDYGVVTHGETPLYPPILTKMMTILDRKVLANGGLFEESSTQIMDISTLTGFGSRWSVIEFIYTLEEATRPHDQVSPFENYGEGVMFFAAAMLQITNQVYFHNASNIAKRIHRAMATDFASAGDQRIVRFCKVHEVVRASLEFTDSIVAPIIAHIKSKP